MAAMDAATDWMVPIMNPERPTISIMKACALVDVSRRTIYNWLASGKIEYVRTPTGHVRIVDTLFRGHTRRTPLANNSQLGLKPILPGGQGTP